MLKISRSLLVAVFLLFLFHPIVRAEALPDTDQDGISDQTEIERYFTDPNLFDSDGDGYGDGEELRNGFSPYNSKAGVKLEDSDADKDGLNDRMEINFHTNPLVADTDGDGYTDGEEVKNGYDPLHADVKLEKQIKVNLAKQEVEYFLGDVRLGKFRISSGKASMPTPKGTFTIDGKTTRAWSKTYGLWMPYWMSLSHGRFGFHELPEWPSGKKEGASHLGRPVSHGCIRLGIGDAKTLYDWAPIGTKVIIY